jgi:hypothetical protein
MDGNGNIEQRVAALEREVAELKRSAKGDQGNWLEEVSGRMKDIPEEDFREFVRLCKEFRNAQTDPY